MQSCSVARRFRPHRRPRRARGLLGRGILVTGMQPPSSRRAYIFAAPDTRERHSHIRLQETSRSQQVIVSLNQQPDRSVMTSRPASFFERGSLVAVALLLSAASLAAGAGVSIDASCSMTAFPDVCKAALLACPESKEAATPRALAEVAIRAASNVGASAGSYARDQMQLVKDNDLWMCLDECAEDIEEAVSHLDDTEGEIDEAKFNDVKLFLDTAERDSWSCDESCKYVPETAVKAQLLAKNKDFETIMTVTNALIKQATGGGDAPAPAPFMPAAP